MGLVVKETPKVGDRIRVAMLYERLWRPLIWFRVGRDGSIYMGMLLREPTIGKTVSKVVPQPPVTIIYDEARPIANQEALKSSRVSFKASGEIHMGGKVLRGPRLETLSIQTLLCLFLFVHPSRYRPPR